METEVPRATLARRLVIGVVVLVLLGVGWNLGGEAYREWSWSRARSGYSLDDLATAARAEAGRAADPALLAELDAARSRWEASRPSDWTAVISTWNRLVEQSDLVTTGTIRVVVADGEVVEAIDLPTGREVESALVDPGALFALARASAPAAVEWTFDDVHGLPTYWNAEGVDAETSITVTDFRPVAEPLRGDGDVEQALADARARWAAAGITTYALEVHVTCSCAISDGRIEVVDGVVVGDDLEFVGATVEDLFDGVARSLDADSILVRFDPETGVPLEVYVDEIRRGIDDEHALRIEMVARG